jgi:hypothetical protein
MSPTVCNIDYGTEQEAWGLHGLEEALKKRNAKELHAFHDT